MINELSAYMNRILLPVRMNCILLLHPDSDHINYTTNHPLIKPRQRNVYIYMQKNTDKINFQVTACNKILIRIQYIWRDLSSGRV